jgi:hypothetical protein
MPVHKEDQPTLLRPRSGFALDALESRSHKAGMPRKLRIEYAGAIYHVMSRAAAAHAHLMAGP